MTIQLSKFSKLWMASLLLFASVAISQAQTSSQTKASLFRCDKNNAGFCTELRHDHQYFGHYSGHDEPALLFYSAKPGAGNNAVYHLTLPLDPPVPPNQDGSGGTFSFQLHPAFWFGMVLCDPQSSPNFTPVCVPKTDANIFDNGDPNAADFIGHHPGSAFLELQFYPPGGLNSCSDPTLWCVAMAIFSFNVQDLTGQINNLSCQEQVGLEPSNFAFLTTNGISQSAADPLNPDVNNKFGVIPGTTFQMNPGDDLILDMHDTPDGLQVAIKDLTARTTGSMTASIANGFAHINFAPDPPAPQQPRTCTSSPFAFHPMYSTSSEHTRATWAAHTYNVAFSDEIGHFELCNAVDFEGGNCIQAGADDPNGLDDDDTGCFTGDFLALFGLQPIGTCINGDSDFDGASYQRRWAGTGNPRTDAQLKPTALRFTSPQFLRSKGGGDNPTEYDRVAFEVDMPDIEFESNPACDVFNGGQGCTNPPNGTAFYPLFTAARHDGQCVWQMGGPNIPGTTNNFGGSSTTEFGDISGIPFAEPATFDQPNGSSILIFGNFRRILAENPCRSGQN
jgi:hypothetical protein